MLHLLVCHVKLANEKTQNGTLRVHCLFFKMNSLYQSLHGSSGEATDAYEAALGAVMQEEIVQHIWME